MHSGMGFWHLSLLSVVVLLFACGGSDGNGNNSGGSLANALCTNSSDCQASEICVAEADNATSTITQICRAAIGASKNGSTCTIDADCQSNRCGQSLDGVNRCLGPCDVTSQSGCAAGTTCYPNVIYEQFAIDPPGREGDIFDSFATCSSNVGAYNTCSKDADCAVGESCSVAYDETRSAVTGRCITNIGAQPGGANCFNNADCQSGQCLIGLGDTCYSACLINTDCAVPMTCTLSVTLDNMGTMNTTDDLIVKSCEP